MGSNTPQDKTILNSEQRWLKTLYLCHVIMCILEQQIFEDIGYFLWLQCGTKGVVNQDQQQIKQASKPGNRYKQLISIHALNT
jgi:hypothetical protein